MKRTKFAVALLVGIVIVLAGFGVARTHHQGDDDHKIINHLATMKQRKDFFRTLTPERKSVLWRKHFAGELVKHVELTRDQRAVIDLAIVIASSDLFRDNLPEPCGPGSVFRTAAENAFKDAPELRREIFGQPGEPLPKFAHVNNSQDEGAQDCECNKDSWCNDCIAGCGRLGCVIPVSDTGCGCFWQSQCNRNCWRVFTD